ncbi:hypothetical protein SteCoe_11029 [Stentor coeruleus]|uniref:Uncharacterized protein n=1 Tax=Stentor coeruleus TaxID=5963 RepID=A0A1R2CE32_9CILI|nr:hypothetical protein SteCoe_11029 [Stentor coeruleus]
MSNHLPINRVGPQLANSTDAINKYIGKLEEGIMPSFEFSIHKNPIRALSISSNILAVGSADKSISIWSISEKKLIANLTGHQDWVLSIGFIKDNKYLASGSGDGILKYWDLENYQEILSFKAHSGNVACLATSQNYVFTGSSDKTVKFWIPLNEKEQFVFAGHSEFVYCLVVSDDEKYLYTGSRDYTIKVWHILYRELEYTLEGHDHWVYCLSLTANGKFLVSGSEDKTVRVWNLLERAENFVFKGHKQTVTSVAVTSDNKYIISGSHSQIKVWGFKEQEEIFTLQGHKDFVRSIVLTSDRKYIISAGDDILVKFWNISDVCPKIKLSQHTAAISSVDSKKVYIVSASEDKTWCLWNHFGELLHTYKGHNDRIFCVKISFDSKLIASCSADRTIKIYNIKDKSDISLTGYNGWVRCIAWENDSNDNSINNDLIYSGCDDNIIYITSLDQRQIVGHLTGHENCINCLLLSNDRKTLYSGSSDKAIIAWNLNSKSIIYILNGHKDNVNGLCTDSTNSILISASSDCSIIIWDLTLRREKFSFIAHEKPINSICLNPQTELIFTSSEDFYIKAWNIIERREEYSIFTTFTLNSICVYENILIGGSKDKSLYIWDIMENTGSNLEAQPYQSNFDFITTTCNYSLTLQSLNSKQASLPLGDNLFTLSHIFAHQGNEVKLSKVLNSKPRIRTDKFGRSPIYYSIKRQSKPCTDMLLKYLIKISSNSEQYLNEVYALRRDVIDLIYNSSVVLPEFLNTLLIVQNKCFARPSRVLAIVRRSCLQKIYVEDFTKAKNVVNTGQEANLEILLQFQTTGFELPEVLGSLESLKLIKALLKSSNRKIFESTLVQYYIRSKWNELWLYALLYTLLIWINLLLILVFVASIAFNIYCQFFFVFINTLIFLVEIIQLLNAGIREYASNPWNWIDYLRFVLTIAWFIIKCNGISIPVLEWLMIFVNILKGATGFRAFDKTRFYVRLFFRSFQDILYFLIIFFYSTLSFGLLFASNKNLDTEELIRYIWLSPFDLNLGNFSSNEYVSLDYFGFFLASIVNIIVLLSLLISILGDSFDRFRLEAVEIDNTEMAKFVYDLELLIFWNKKKNFSSYLQICDTLFMNYQLNEWEGSTKAIEMKVSKAFDERLKIVEADMRNNYENLSREMQAVKNLVVNNIESNEKKIASIDKRLMLIFDFLNK